MCTETGFRYAFPDKDWDHGFWIHILTMRPERTKKTAKKDGKSTRLS